MGGQRERRRRRRVLEQHAFAREPIEIRRRARGEPVGAESIRARRVERDKQQVEVGRVHP